MYMAMVGMALIAVPRGVFRFVTWFVVGVVAWCMAAVEGLADVIAQVNGTTLNVTIEDGTTDPTVQIYSDNGDVYVSDGNNPSLMGIDAPDVTAIVVDGSSVGDWILLGGVTDAAGAFDDPNLYVEIQGDGGNDTIDGSRCAPGDIINGGAGDDCILGDKGDDILLGGTGADYLSGGDGDDQLFHNISGGSAGSADGSADTLDGGDEVFGDIGHSNSGEGDTENDIEL